MLFLDYFASQLNLTWSKNKSIHAYITQSITVYVDPSQYSKQTKISKKEKKAKKKEKKWEFDSESDEDIKATVNGDTIVQDNLSSVNDSQSLSDSSSNMPTPVSTPTLKPKKFKPKLDPVPLNMTLLKPMLLMNVSGKSVSKAGLSYLCSFDCVI